MTVRKQVLRRLSANQREALTSEQMGCEVSGTQMVFVGAHLAGGVGALGYRLCTVSVY